MEPSPMRQFETERMSRVIDAEQSVPALQGLCRQLAQATAVQEAAAERFARELLQADHRQAMEAARVRASNPAQRYFPSTGVLITWGVL